MGGPSDVSFILPEEKGLSHGVTYPGPYNPVEKGVFLKKLSCNAKETKYYPQIIILLNNGCIGYNFQVEKESVVVASHSVT